MRDYTHNILPARPTQRGNYGDTVFVLLLAVLFWLGIGAWAAFAEVTSEASAGAEANVSVNTGAAAFGGGASITEQKQAPGLGALALGGGNPCAYSPATAQVSFLGGGAGIGGMKIDEACALIVLGAASNDARAYKAAGLVIAGRNPAACKAMEQAGMVDCVTAKDRKLAKSSTPASTKGDGGNGKCVMTGKKLAFRVSTGGDRNAELVACKAKYGL